MIPNWEEAADLTVSVIGLQIRIMFLVRIWVSRGSSPPIYSGTGSLLNGYEDLPCDGCCKTSSTVDWRWRAPGKSNTNEEKNSNPIPETVTSVSGNHVLIIEFYFLLIMSDTNDGVVRNYSMQTNCPIIMLH